MYFHPKNLKSEINKLTAVTINFSCQKIRSVFRVLEYVTLDFPCEVKAENLGGFFATSQR